MKRFAVISIVFLAAATLSSVGAACGLPLTIASTGGPQAGFQGGYFNLGDDGPNGAYINFGFSRPAPGEVIARWWQTDNTGVNEGGAGGELWLGGVAGFPNYWYFYFDTGSGGVGCPQGANVTVYIEHTATGKSLLWTTLNQAINNIDWNYQACTASVGDSPRARVNSSGSAGTDVNMNVTVPNPANISCDLSGTDAGAVTSIGLYTCPSATVPGLLVDTGCNGGPWTLLTSLGATGGTTDVSVDCSDTGVRQYVGTGLTVDGITPRFVGNPTVVECDPNLADPGNFQIINRPRKAPFKKERN